MLLTASQAEAEGCKCVHSVRWTMERTRFMRNSEEKAQAAETARGCSRQESEHAVIYLIIYLFGCKY